MPLLFKFDMHALQHVNQVKRRVLRAVLGVANLFTCQEERKGDKEIASRNEGLLEPGSIGRPVI